MPFPGKHEEIRVFPISNDSPLDNYYIFMHMDKKVVLLQNALKFILVRLTGGDLPWRDDVPFVTTCRKLSVPLKVGMATEAGLFFYSGTYR